jgi:hypothetical protein
VMIRELRIYRFVPGKKQEFLRLFRRARTFMSKYGITFDSAWENPDREDEFLWMRSFADQQARDAAIRDYYMSPEWLEIEAQIKATVRRREVRLLHELSLPE